MDTGNYSAVKEKHHSLTETVFLAGQTSEDQYGCTDLSWLLSSIILVPFSLVLSGPWIITHDFTNIKDDAETKTSRTKSWAAQVQKVGEENLFWL